MEADIPASSRVDATVTAAPDELDEDSEGDAEEQRTRCTQHPAVSSDTFCLHTGRFMCIDCSKLHDDCNDGSDTHLISHKLAKCVREHAGVFKGASNTSTACIPDVASLKASVARNADAEIAKVERFAAEVAAKSAAAVDALKALRASRLKQADAAHDEAMVRATQLGAAFAWIIDNGNGIYDDITPGLVAVATSLSPYYTLKSTPLHVDKWEWLSQFKANINTTNMDAFGEVEAVRGLAASCAP